MKAEIIHLLGFLLEGFCVVHNLAQVCLQVAQHSARVRLSSNKIRKESNVIYFSQWLVENRAKFKACFSLETQAEA